MPYRFAHRRYRLPFQAPVRTSQGSWAAREGLLLRLKDKSGAVGWGEAAPIPWFGTETVDKAEAACREIGPAPEAGRIADLPSDLAALKSGLCAALADLAGAAWPERAPLPVAALLPAGLPAIAAVGPRAESGFRTFKWKVGAAAAREELPLLDDLCAELPEGARLRLDANGAWDRRTAEKWLDRCADRPVEFLEQPIAPGARGAEDLLLGLASDYPTPIGLDKSLIGEASIGLWLAAGWPGVFVVKPSILGEPSVPLSRLAAAGARVVFSSALETAVGARSALRLAFSWTGPAAALGFGVWPLFGVPGLDGPAAAPFIRAEDVRRIDPEAAWNALS